MAKRRDAPRGVALDGAPADTEDLGDVGLGEVEVVAQGQDLALPARELSQRPGFLVFVETRGEHSQLRRMSYAGEAMPATVQSGARYVPLSAVAAVETASPGRNRNRFRVKPERQISRWSTGKLTRSTVLVERTNRYNRPCYG